MQVVFRPRFLTRVERFDLHDEDSTSRSSQFLVDVLYAQLDPAPFLSLAYGRQSFEWGTAEFANASNRLFHVNAMQKDTLYVVHGKELARVSLFLGRCYSLVGLMEVRDNGDRPFGEPAFDRKGLVKLEYASESGGQRLGLVVGRGAATEPWVGFYTDAEVVDGLSLHVDVALSTASRSWHPVAGADGVRFQRWHSDVPSLEVLGVVGAKYTTLMGLELGLEYVKNTAGYNRDELRLAYRAISTPSAHLRDNAEALSNPGLEVLGRDYLYLVLRWPSAIARWDVNLGAGYLFSLTDHSSRALAYVEASLTDSLVAFTNATFAHGDVDAELAALSSGSVLGGLRLSW
jgi:hypothetical protein